MGTKLRLSETTSLTIIKETKKIKMIKLIKQLKDEEKLTLDYFTDLTKQGLKLVKILSEDTKIQMLKKHLRIKLADGTGLIERKKYMLSYPNQLEIDEKEVRKIIIEIASTEMRKTLVEAISLYRQGSTKEILNVINNLVSQFRVFPNPVSWRNKDEIKQIYDVYIKMIDNEEIKQIAALAMGIHGNIG